MVSNIHFGIISMDKYVSSRWVYSYGDGMKKMHDEGYLQHALDKILSHIKYLVEVNKLVKKL